MFFYLAKIFWFVAQPLGLTSVLLIAALVAIALGWKRLGVFSAFLALLVLFVSCWTSVGAMAIAPLEARFSKPNPPPAEVAGIIVLGGFFEGTINLARGGYDLNSGGDRIVEAAVLARRYPQARVVISGGTGSRFFEGEADAVTAPRLLEALGIARDRLVLEDRSRDTYENAIYTRELVIPQPGETWLLVTSAFHMPRAVLLFHKSGFDIVPWPTDYRSTGQDPLGWSRSDPVSTLQTTSAALREWIGLVAYWLSGRTDAILP